MKIKITCLLLLLSSVCFAQDTIRTFRQKRYLTKISQISKDSVTFKNFSNPDSKVYSLHKGEISEIKLHDGTVVDFLSEEEKSKSIEDFKSQLIAMINEFGFEPDSNKKRFYASFEGDFLRLQIKNSTGSKMDKGLLYDFTRVYDVHNLSQRGDTNTFINIWVLSLVNPKAKRWEKQKIVMKVKGHNEAEDILRMFKVLNKKLRDRKI